MSKYELGVRLHDYGCAPADELFARITADGLSTCQLAFPKAIPDIHNYFEVTEETAAKVREAMDRYHVSIGVLGCYVELAIDQEDVRLANVESVRHMIPIAKALGAGCIGFETTTMKLQQPSTTREMAQELMYDSLRRLLPDAEKYGVCLGLEPVYDHSVNTAAAARKMLDRLNSPSMRIILDAGNILTADRVSSQASLWKEAIDLLGPYLVALHFKTQRYTAEGAPKACLLAENVIDWDCVFHELKRVPQTLPLLREEMVLANAKTDIAEFHRLLAL